MNVRVTDSRTIPLRIKLSSVPPNTGFLSGGQFYIKLDESGVDCVASAFVPISATTRKFTYDHEVEVVNVEIIIR